MRNVLEPVLHISAAAILLSACSGHIGHVERTPNGEVFERIYNNMGGHVATEYAAWQKRVNQHGINHYVIDGTCASFCSFVAFYSPKSCYTRSARLAVHPASAGAFVSTHEIDEFTDRLVALWPTGLRNWWAANRPSALGTDLVYEDLKRIIPERECGPEMEAISTSNVRKS